MKHTLKISLIAIVLATATACDQNDDDRRNSNTSPAPTPTNAPAPNTGSGTLQLVSREEIGISQPTQFYLIADEVVASGANRIYFVSIDGTDYQMVVSQESTGSSTRREEADAFLKLANEVQDALDFVVSQSNDGQIDVSYRTEQNTFVSSGWTHDPTLRVDTVGSGVYVGPDLDGDDLTLALRSDQTADLSDGDCNLTGTWTPRGQTTLNTSYIAVSGPCDGDNLELEGPILRLTGDDRSEVLLAFQLENTDTGALADFQFVRMR